MRQKSVYETRVYSDEGQRYFQDRGREFMMNEFEQVRRHQEMLRRLITA